MSDTIVELRNQLGGPQKHPEVSKEEKKLNNKLIANQEEIDVAMAKIKVMEDQKKKVKGLKILQPPTSSASPLSPDTKRNVVIGAIVGLFLALIVSVGLEFNANHERD